MAWFAVSSALCGLAPLPRCWWPPACCKGSARHCSPRPAWPSCRPLSVPRTGLGPSAPGPASAGWPPRPVRCSVDTSSPSARGAGCSSSTCPSPPRCSWSPAATSPRLGDPDANGRIDVTGALLGIVWLSAITYALIEGPTKGWASPVVVTCFVVGAAGFAVFLAVERRSAQPMLPLRLFRARQFSAANAVTFIDLRRARWRAVPAAGRAPGGLRLHAARGRPDPAAGDAHHAAFSARSGRLATRIGPRLQMSVGPVVVAAGPGVALADDLGRQLRHRRAAGGWWCSGPAWPSPWPR